MKVYIIMGVAGCGKSTVGRAAAERLGLPFLEGDDFHSKSNVEKMSAGIALTDGDRMPWVDAMVAGCHHEALNSELKMVPMILACSALSQTVRERLRSGLSHHCQFIHLHGEQDKIAERLSARKDHFFKPALLASQFEALDMPKDAITLDIFQSIDVLTQQLCDIIPSEYQA